MKVRQVTFVISPSGKTDIDRTYISGIERGIRNPSLDMLVKLAKTLKMTPAALLAK